MKRLGLFLIVLCLVFSVGCEKVTKVVHKSQKDVYYVMFDNGPHLYDNGVYLPGKAIGEIVANDRIGLGGARITIVVDPAYEELIKDNTVFYETMGKLTLGSLGSFGTPLAPGGKMLGFDSKMSLFWFKTRTVLTQSSLVAARKAEQLFSQAAE